MIRDHRDLLRRIRRIVGRIKGSSFVLWFVIPRRSPLRPLAAIAYRFERDELRRECPSCGRVTKIYDALCTRCGPSSTSPRSHRAGILGAHSGALIGIAPGNAPRRGGCAGRP